MARGKKTGGRRQGTPNKRTLARLELQRSGGIDAASPALAEMRKCAERILNLANEERKKGEQANGRLLKEYWDCSAKILKEITQYEMPKLTPTRSGDALENARPVDIRSLTNEQLSVLLERLEQS